MKNLTNISHLFLVLSSKMPPIDRKINEMPTCFLVESSLSLNTECRLRNVCLTELESGTAHLAALHCPTQVSPTTKLHQVHR